MPNLLQLVTVLVAAAILPIEGACRTQATMTRSNGPEGTLSVEEVMGLWSLTATNGTGVRTSASEVGASGRATCRIALSRLASGDGYGVQVERCSIPEFVGASRWRFVAGGFEVLSARGRPLGRFHASGPDRFVGIDGAYRLDRAPMA